MTAADAGNIIQLVRCDSNWARDNAGINVKYVANGFLTSLSSYFSSDSLPKAPFPNYQVEDTEAERTLKTVNHVWSPTTPKFYGQLWLSTLLDPTPSDWIQWAKYSLINNEGYPYSLDEPINLLTKGMTEDFQAPYSIGFSVVDANWGHLKTVDTLNIKGTWKLDNRIIQDDLVATVIVQGGTVSQVTQNTDRVAQNTGTTRRILIPANTRRILASVKHGSTATSSIYLAIRDITPSATNNDGVVSAGSTWNAPTTYTGDIYAIASGAAVPYESTHVYNS